MCESLKKYLKEYRNANTLDEKINICKKYKDTYWKVEVGMEAWDEINGFAFIEHQIDEIGKVKLIIPIDIACSYKMYKVQAPLQVNLINELKCELLAVAEI